MILLLGATSYIGQAFARELRRRRCCFVPLSREAFDYTCFEFLFDYVRRMKPEFLINAAGESDGSDIEACEMAHEETLLSNTILPQTIARVCLMTNTPWGHVSSGCIFAGAKVVENGRLRIETDLSRPGLRELFEAEPDRFYGFTEMDEPNFSFRHAPCSFYSGAKALAEEAIRELLGEGYIWRPRTPFSERDEPCNWLSEIQRCTKVSDQLSSVSHLEDCVRACLDLWERRAPFGIYNVTNPGAITTRQVVEMIQRILKPKRRFEYWKDDEEFHRFGAKAPQSGCLLNVSKLLGAGVKMRPVHEAVEDALDKWEPASPTMSRILNGVREPLSAAG